MFLPPNVSALSATCCHSVFFANLALWGVHPIYGLKQSTDDDRGIMTQEFAQYYQAQLTGLSKEYVTAANDSGMAAAGQPKGRLQPGLYTLTPRRPSLLKLGMRATLPLI
jgi:hypothetical protein